MLEWTRTHIPTRSVLISSVSSSRSFKKCSATAFKALLGQASNQSIVVQLIKDGKFRSRLRNAFQQEKTIKLHASYLNTHIKFLKTICSCLLFLIASKLAHFIYYFIFFVVFPQIWYVLGVQYVVYIFDEASSIFASLENPCY